MIAMAEELDRLRTDGITAEELAGAKIGYLQSRRVGRTRPDRLVYGVAGDFDSDR